MSDSGANDLIGKGIGQGPIKLTGINLELSSACNLNCHRCSRKTYIGAGKDKFMSAGALGKILSELKYLQSIDLTGWGEPLLHPEFGWFLKKIRGNFSGQLIFTTNGILLDKFKIEEILENQVDSICFSVDAANEYSYRKVRGEHWEELELAIKNLVLRKRMLGSRKPKIYASFLLGKSRLSELSAFAGKMKGLGVEGIILQQMTGVFSEPELNELTYSGYYGTDFPDQELRERVEDLERKLKGQMELIRPEKIYPEAKGGCGVFPLENLLIKAVGDVCPCCALGYPVLLINRKKELRRPTTVVLGNILEKTLREIWEGPEAVSFREEMQSKGFSEFCGDCLGLYLGRE